MFLFVFYSIHLEHFTDNVSIIKHMIQDPLEIYWAFYKFPWILDQFLNVYRLLPVLLFFHSRYFNQYLWDGNYKGCSHSCSAVLLVFKVLLSMNTKHVSPQTHHERRHWLQCFIAWFSILIKKLFEWCFQRHKEQLKHASLPKN